MILPKSLYVLIPFCLSTIISSLNSQCRGGGRGRESIFCVSLSTSMRFWSHYSLQAKPVICGSGYPAATRTWQGSSGDAFGCMMRPPWGPEESWHETEPQSESCRGPRDFSPRDLWELQRTTGFLPRGPVAPDICWKIITRRKTSWCVQLWQTE